MKHRGKEVETKKENEGTIDTYVSGWRLAASMRVSGDECRPTNTNVWRGDPSHARRSIYIQISGAISRTFGN